VNAAGQDVLLQAVDGSISETTGKAIASGLLARASGDVDLFSVNQVGTFAARYGGGVSFNNVLATGLTIGSVSVSSPSISDNASGVGDGTGTGDVALVAMAGDLVLASDVAATGHNVLLQALDGSVTETTGAVVASGLLVRASANVDLSAANQVGTFAARYGGGLSFEDAQTGGFIVGSVSLSSPSLSDTASGVGDGSGTGDVALVATAGDLVLASDVTATGHNVLLQALDGSVTETAGTVVASGLLVRASADVDLSAANQVGTFAARYGGGVSFDDAQPGGLVIGSVSVSSPSIGDSASGVGDGTGTGDVALLVTAGDLVLASDVNGANILLAATAGNIIETNGRLLAKDGTGALVLQASGSMDLQQANQVGTLAAAACGGIAFNDATALTVGTASVLDAPSSNGSLSGVEAGADIALVAPSIVLSAKVTGQTVLLNATTGSAVETTGTVHADGLLIEAQTDIVMQSANNVGTLAAISASGNVSFRNAVALTEGMVSVNPPSDGGSGDGLSGATVSIDAPALQRDGPINSPNFVFNNQTASLEGISGISSTIALDERIEERIKHGDKAQTPAQLAFWQYTDNQFYAQNPFAKRYDIIGFGPQQPGYDPALSYFVDGFWEGKLK
jgi:hypothetical protein